MRKLLWSTVSLGVTLTSMPDALHAGALSGLSKAAADFINEHVLPHLANEGAATEVRRWKDTFRIIFVVSRTRLPVEASTPPPSPNLRSCRRAKLKQCNMHLRRFAMSRRRQSHPTNP